MKTLKLQDLHKILTAALLGDTIDDQTDQLMFVDDLTTVITRHFGGTSWGLTLDDGLLLVDIEVDDQVPADGGIYNQYDQQVMWKDGKEWINTTEPEDVSDRLYIINDLDRPCPEHLVHRRKDGVWAYVDRELDARGFLFSTILRAEATSLQTFGLQALRRGRVVQVRRVGPSTAVYSSDDQPRKWQDVDDFVMRLPEDSGLC